MAKNTIELKNDTTLVNYTYLSLTEVSLKFKVYYKSIMFTLSLIMGIHSEPWFNSCLDYPKYILLY